MRDGLTVVDKLLLAAHGIEKTGKCPFTAEDVVVAAWTKYPDTFGLKGYLDDNGMPKYPDSNRVYAELMGAKPVRKQGLIIKSGTKMYSLTETGRDRARYLSGVKPSESQGKFGLGRTGLTELRRLLESKAAVKMRDEKLDEITFHDACMFWRITPRSSAIQFDGRLANIQGILAQAREGVGRQNLSFEHGGKAIDAADIELLFTLNDELLQKFESQVVVIRKRTDER